MTRYDVLIVGAGHAGAQAAVMLRQKGFEGTVGIAGDEPDLPYERPPLSKDYLSGDKPFERILIRPESFWDQHRVTMLPGTRVTSVDPEAHSVTTHVGEVIGYGKLIWATGGTPRRLPCPGGDLAGVHTIRTRADVDRLIGELPGVTRAVIIGGGYIGLEAAAVLRKFDKQVWLLEALDRVLARVAGEPLSRFFEAEHRAHGVEIHLGVAVECIKERGGRACGVRLADGTIFPAELVIVGIGIIPAVAPLLAAGADGGNGVRVDAQCRSSLTDIYAVGDCALHLNLYAGDLATRVESVQNASDQATIAARSILGENIAYDSVPWFWSNQYDLRLQTIGISSGYDQALLRGDPAKRSFSIIYLKAGRVIALDCVNAVKDYVQGKRLVVEGLVPDPVKLVDLGVPLKELA